MFDTQTINIATFIVIFTAGLYMWANILTIKEEMKLFYPTGGLKEQPKDGNIGSGVSYKEWKTVYKKVSEKEAYILEIGDASWAGSKERMLEILIYNKMIYEENGESFDFEIYPMIPKRCNN